jgi:hypothetical protein
MKKKTEWFEIIDLNKFIESTRVLVFNSFGTTNKNKPDELTFILEALEPAEVDELNTVLTQEECLIISQDFFKKQTHKKTKQIRHMINNNQYLELVESFNSRMISNMLNNLVNKGMLETAYDNTSNDFVFWVKETNDEKENKKPKTN